MENETVIPETIEAGAQRALKVEIWSDVMCPFCYIGKRKFEKALEAFPGRGNVEITWKSFQLDPDIRSGHGKSVTEYLAERKGWTLDQSRQAHAQVTRSAASVGLAYDFDKAVVANSFDAHRMVQFSKAHGKGDALEEALFKAYFTEGKDIADHAVLADLAVEAGLNRKEAEDALADGSYADGVRRDILEARQIGVQGVPFFVFDRRFAVSGAQGSEVFLRALEEAAREAASPRPPKGSEDPEG
jgi:predicted DsbA family dithiol-disulfide isomerase